jgi:hypothetical protein
MSDMTQGGLDENTGTGSKEPLIIFFGLELIILSAPLAYFLLQQLPASSVQQWWVIPVPQVEIGVSLLPPASPQLDVNRWAGRLFSEVIEAILELLTLVMMASSIMGVIVCVLVGIYGSDTQQFATSLRSALEFRPTQVVIGIYVIIGSIMLFPRLIFIFVEIFIIISVGGALVSVLGSAWLRMRDSQQPLIRVIAVYPLGVGTFTLPLVGVTLLSPTFGPFMRSATVRIADFLLSTVFAAVGLDQWLRAAFSLEGISLFLMWAGLIVSAGWIVGGTAEVYK